MENKINKDDYLSIGEFAKVSGMSRKNLIYYDNIGLFSPEITLDNGYRYYYYRQLYTLNMITTLKDIGVPLKEIKAFTENRNPEKTIELFSAQRDIIDKDINRLIQIRDMMSMHIETSTVAIKAKTDEITIQYFDEQPIFVGRNLQMVKGQRTTFSKMLTSFYQYANSEGYYATFPWGVYIDYGSIKERFQKSEPHNYPENDSLLNFYFSVPVSNVVKPKGKYVVMYSRSFDYDGKEYQIISKYAKEHNIRLNSIIYADYVINEISANKPEDYLIRISIPIDES